MGRVIHFEFNADDPARAANFYKQVFSWKIEKWSGPEDYWLIETGADSEPGINGAITRRTNGWSTVDTIAVSSVDEFSKRIVEAGGSVATPKTEIPGVGFFAYCQDTEGNVFGILEPTMPAK